MGTVHPRKKKKKKIHWRCLEAKGEKINVPLAKDASHVVCVNFTCQGLAWGRMQQYFELVAYVDGVVVFGDGYCLLVKKKQKRSIGNVLRRREGRSVGHWPEMHYAPCV